MYSGRPEHHRVAEGSPRARYTALARQVWPGLETPLAGLGIGRQRYVLAVMRNAGCESYRAGRQLHRSALSGIPSSERAGEGAILVSRSHHLVTRCAEFTDEGSRISLTRLGYMNDHDHVRLLGPGAEDREML